jgi:putative MATE family efflux protein
MPSRRAKGDLVSGSLAWNLFRLAGPIAATSLLQALYSLVDAFWLGRFSKTALAGPGATMPLFFVVFAVGFGFGTAGTALVAQHTGAGNRREADRAAGQTLLLLVALGALLGGPIVAFTPQLLRLIRVPPEAIGDAQAYLRIYMLAAPLMGFAIGYSSVLRALGDTITFLYIGAAANLANLVLDPALINGWWIAPRMGAGGAALASLSARGLEAAVCVVCLGRGRMGLRLHARDFRPDWPILGRILKVGLPVALNRSSDSVGFTVFQSMVNSLGVAVVGAFVIGFRIIHLFNLPAHSMAMAAAPVVGQALGARQPHLARRAVRSSAWVVAALLFLPLQYLWRYGDQVARAFTDEADVIAEAAAFFSVVPASSYCFGVLMVLLAAFYGSGHTTPAMVVGVVRLWVLRVPLAWLLGFGLGMGSTGVYLGMVIANIVCALLALAMFLLVDWQRPVVELEGDREGLAGGTDETRAAASGFVDEEQGPP